MAGAAAAVPRNWGAGSISARRRAGPREEGSVLPLTGDDAEATTLVVVEDEPLFRDLLHVSLSGQVSLRVLASFGDAETALAAAPQLRPQAAILDIALGMDMTGVELGLRLRRVLPCLGVVLLSNYAEPRFLDGVPAGQRSGWSYLLKRSVSDLAVLVRAVTQTVGGGVVLDPLLVTAMRPRAGSPLEGLTARQAEILSLVAQGLSNCTIAQRLWLSEKTVENQLLAIYQTIGVRRASTGGHPRVQAVLAYLKGSRLDGEATAGA